jgi:hypothetical protein
VAVLTALVCSFLSLRIATTVGQSQSLWLFPGLYFVELTTLSGACAIGFVRSGRARSLIAWMAGGATAAFAILGAWSVGLYYLPLAAVLLILGLLSDTRRRSNVALHCGAAVVAAIGQALAILALARLL